MIKKIALLSTVIALSLNATGLLIEGIGSGALNYTITHATFTRPTGFIIDVPTQFGVLKTQPGIRYQTAEIILSGNTLGLVLSNTMTPLSQSFRRWLPKFSNATAHMLRLETNITSDENCFLCSLFSNDNYPDIADAPRNIQFKFLDLMNFLQQKFPEITFQYDVPFFTRVLYVLGLSGW